MASWKLPAGTPPWLGGIFFLLMSAAFGIIAVARQEALDEARELAATGVQTRAVVTAMRVTGKRGSSHNLSYRFRAEGRDAGATDRRIYHARYDELSIGDEIPVRYDPANPHRHVTAPELEELERWSDRLGFGGFALVWLGMSVAYFRTKPGATKNTSAAKATRKPRKSRGRK